MKLVVIDHQWILTEKLECEDGEYYQERGLEERHKKEEKCKLYCHTESTKEESSRGVVTIVMQKSRTVD